MQMAPEIWLLFFNERKENPIKIYKVHENEKIKIQGEKRREIRNHNETKLFKIIQSLINDKKTT